MSIDLKKYGDDLNKDGYNRNFVECKSDCNVCINRLKRIVDSDRACLRITGIHSIMYNGQFQRSVFYCSNWAKDKHATKKRS